MGTTAGDTAAHLKKQLVEEGHRFSFIQACRILRYVMAQESAKTGGQASEERIRVRPDLTFAFPESDVVAIDERTLPNGDTGYRITASFLGLYGASSPLPTFYTEDLFAEEHDERSAMREFLDILNAPLYALFFRIWGACRLFYRIAESGDGSTLEHLRGLAGLSLVNDDTQLAGSDSMLRYIGILSGMPRSAEGLRGMLADWFEGIPVNITQCAERRELIPERQRFMLGASNNRLGVDSHIGEAIMDRMGAFTVSFGPLNGAGFHRLLPDGGDYARLNELIGLYIDQPLTWNIEVIVHPRAVKCARLGGESWSRLGWNTWIFSDNVPPQETRVTYSVT